MSFETNKAIFSIIKCRKTLCHLAAEREKLEPKKGISKKLIKSGAPVALWDDCLDLSPASCPIPHMSITNWMGKSLKPLCLTECLTSASFVCLNSSYGQCFETKQQHNSKKLYSR